MGVGLHGWTMTMMITTIMGKMMTLCLDGMIEMHLLNPINSNLMITRMRRMAKKRVLVPVEIYLQSTVRGRR